MTMTLDVTDAEMVDAIDEVLVEGSSTDGAPHLRRDLAVRIETGPDVARATLSESIGRSRDRIGVIVRRCICD